MSLEGTEVSRAGPARRRPGIRVTVVGLMALVAVFAVVIWIYVEYVAPRVVEERPTLKATFRRTSPVADGIIGEKEYEGATLVDFTGDNGVGTLESGMGDSIRAKAPDDLSFTLSAAYTATSLFLAIRVRDQFVDAQDADRAKPHLNDSVEVFFDADRVANDFFTPAGADGIGSTEGFQLAVDAAGHQLTTAQGFANKDWKAATRRVDGGYVIEMEIPLKLLDTGDDTLVSPAGPGSLIHFAMAITDNDEETNKQMSYAYLRTRSTRQSPYWGREGSWKLGIELRARSLFSW